MTAQEFIKAALESKRLTEAHLECLVRYFQAGFPQLKLDGMPGAETRATIERAFPSFFPKPKAPEDVAPFLSCPLPFLPGKSSPQARKPVITSQFRRPDRPNHDGVDFFYRWEPGDEPKFVGDGGCEGKNADGSPKWVVPYGTTAVAAADGVVTAAGPTATGYRVWIDHGNGLRSGYFHLQNVFVQPGDKVGARRYIGTVGHNPADQDGRHLHFEVSPVEKYAPLDPQKYLLPW